MLHVLGNVVKSDSDSIESFREVICLRATVIMMCIVWQLCHVMHSLCMLLPMWLLIEQNATAASCNACKGLRVVAVSSA